MPTDSADALSAHLAASAVVGHFDSGPNRAMSQSELTANELISMGANLLMLLNPPHWDFTQYTKASNEIVSRAQKADLKSTHDISLAMKNAVGGTNSFQYQQKWPEFIGRAHSIDSAIQGEASRKTLILTDATPPDAIVRLTGLQPHQQAMLDDMVTCFKAHLSRPAIVGAWALGYDIVRWWVHSDPGRLKAFNAQSKSGQVAAYSDFFLLGERYVLDTCKNAQGALAGFNENTHHALVHLLNDRNRFAHANYSEATIHRASAYVEKLVETVTGPPFD